ncbi:hypothetical protein DRN39_04150 [Thermococci archaeon]|nr:MAG: hypothetical protein DRN39_04150 [Thermococci archaeon]
MDILVREVLFHEFKHRLDEYNREKFTKLIRKTPLIQLVFASFVFLFFSIIFLRAERLLGGGTIVFSSIAASLLVFIIIISMLLSIEFLHSLGKVGALRLLLSLPINVRFLPFKTWLKYYSPPLFFMMLPFCWKALTYSWKVLVFMFLWTLVSILFGYGIGSIFAFFTFKIQKKGLIWNVLRLLGFSLAGLFMMLFIFYGILFPSAFQKLTMLNLQPYLPPVVQSLSIYYAIEGSLQLKPLFTYIFLSLSVFVLGNTLVERSLVEGVYTSLSRNEFKGMELNPLVALFLKDLKLSLRRTSSLFIMLLPLVFLIPMVFLQKSDLSTWTLIIGSTALLESLNSQILLIEEYKSGWFLFSLPLKVKDFRNAKAFAVSFLYIPSAVVGLAVALYNKADGLPFLLIFGILSNLLMAKFIIFWLTRSLKDEYTIMPAYLTMSDNLIIFGFAALLVNFPAALIRLTYSFFGNLMGYAFLMFELLLIVILYLEK